MSLQLLVQIIEKLDRLEKYVMGEGDFKLRHDLINALAQIGPEEIELLVSTLRALAPEEEASPSKTEEDTAPEHVTTQWVINYFEVSRATFYRSVKDKLLSPVLKLGNRPYYLKQDVIALMVRHEKGSWTFAKLNRQKKGNGS